MAVRRRADMVGGGAGLSRSRAPCGGYGERKREMLLRQAASQALPILRSASAENADRGTIEAARRRLGVVREVLHTLATPRFGKRDTPLKPLAPEVLNRQLLGLPLGRRLSASEIQRAYKQVAKTAHPDGGGSAREFQALSAAREALMRER